MKTTKNLEKRIAAIESRNRKVEMDKAWEGSSTRKFLVAILTYFTVTLFFYFVGVTNPLINAIVPTLGFLLSTLSFSFFKGVWIKKKK